MALTGAVNWDCPACTYLNWSSCPKCTLCGNPRPSDVIPKSTIAKLKLQTQTTLSRNKCSGNHATEASSAERRPGPSSPNTSSNASKWTCSVCTYNNWPNATTCTMCSSTRSNEQCLHKPLLAKESSSRRVSRFESILDYASGSSGFLEASLSSTGVSKRKGHRQGSKSSPHHNDNRNSKKWRCSCCTYENWPRSNKCVMCHTAKTRTPSPPLSDQLQHSSGAIDDSLLHLRLVSSPIKQVSNAKNFPFELASSSPSPPLSSLPPLSKSANDKVRQIRNRLTSSDWLFLNACQGVVNGDLPFVKAFLEHGGDKGRQLTSNEVLVLNDRAKFTVSSTLVHLAIRFQQSDVLSLLLTPAPAEARKRLPSQSNPHLATSLREAAALCLKQHKGDWPCYFFTQLTTFILPAEIRQFCVAVQTSILDDIVDRDVQKELEEGAPIINWNSELTDKLHSRLFPLWNRTAGDCLLDSTLQASWGVVDRDATLRRSLADSLIDGSSRFYSRWKEAELTQAHSQGFSLDEEQLKTDWAAILALADQKGKSLEQAHIFALAHILRRPVIVYGVKMVKNFRGENLGLVNFEGVYLPLLWECSFCWKSPIALAYTRGHFSALVSIACEDSSTDSWSNEEHHLTYLPLVDSDLKLLPLHFLSELQLGYEERILSEYCDCHVTHGGILTAKQSTTHQHTLLDQLTDEWLNKFRKMDKHSIDQRSGAAASAACSYDFDN